MDRGRGAVARAVVAGLFDAVGVVSGSFDDPRVDPLPALGVEVLFAGYVSHDRGEDAFLVLRGRSARPGTGAGCCGRSPAPRGCARGGPRRVPSGALKP